MPAPGPSARSLTHLPDGGAAPYAVVPVTAAVLDTLAAHGPADLSAFATPKPAPPQSIEIGDTIAVSIWELGSGLFAVAAPSTTPGVLIPPGAQAVTIPSQAVDQSGLITVPFAGEIGAAGHTPHEVQEAIRAALRGKANDAQVLVSVTQSVNNAVTVTGDVLHPGRVPLVIGGSRLLDVIAQSGGASARASDMVVQLTRDGRTLRTRLTTLLGDPAQNVYLLPNDLVVLDQEPQSVVVLGATNHNAQIAFGKSSLTLAEALGNGGGLTDQQADPYGVFVLRFEPAAVARAIGAVAGSGAAGLVPVIFQVNLQKPAGLFALQAMALQDRDLVYVANSPSVQLGKIARLFNSVAAIFKSSSVVSN